MSYYDDASLVVIPSGYKTSKVYAEKPTDGSGDLAFTRTGDTATRVNLAGIIEKVRTNLALNSEGNVSTYNTAINVSNAASSFSSFANAIQIPSTGTSVAYKSVVTTAQPYSISVYIKMDDNSVPVLSSSTTSGNVSLIIAGSFATDNLKVESVGNNVYRLSGSAIGSGASNNNGVVRYDTQTLKSFKIAGIQLEVGDVATAYIPTTTAAVSVGPVANVPRLDYLGSTCPRLLLEPQRTNLITYSEQFDNAAWSKAGTTITANNATSPDGYINADRLTSNGGGSDQYVERSGLTTTAGTYTSSVFLKNVNATQSVLMAVHLGEGSATSDMRYNWSTGAVTTNGTNVVSAKATNFGNGWVRFEFTYTIGATVTGHRLRAYVQIGVSTNSVLIWGAQVEAGAYATSYIPTLAASATRGAESSSSANISSLFGATEGSFYVQLTHDGRNTNNAIPVFLRSSINGNFNRATYLQFGATNLTLNVYDAGTLQAAISGGTYTNGQTLKVAFAYKANDFVLYVNGVQLGTDSSGAISSSLSFIDFGSYMLAQSTFQYDGKVSQALLFKTRLTNAQLAELTTL